jgi:hypothetical protein
MRLLPVAVILGTWGLMAQTPAPANESQAIAVPAGTKIMLVLIGAVQSRSAKPGDTVYCETTFPVAIDGQMAIPPGTYVKGNIDILSPPGRFSNQAEFRMYFSQMVFANGYTVSFPDPDIAIATPTVSVSSRSDVLLDNGTQFEMVLDRAVSLDAARVAAAGTRSKAPEIAQWKSATQCRPFPATPGTPGTYVPGTPGTPSTVIPGGPGMPPTVIPGTPATPGISMPGTPGFAGITCPPAPVIRSVQVVHKETFVIKSPVLAAGSQLARGTYEAVWTGLGPIAQVNILQHGQPIASLAATVVPVKAPREGEISLRYNPDGSSSIQLLQFQGRTFALRFN